MNLGQLADALTKAAGIFYKDLKNKFLPKFKGKTITEQSVKEFLKPFLDLASLTPDVRISIEKKLETYAPTALQSIERNRHMNEYSTGDTFDQISAEAIVVDFINNACLPLDLALYTRDLKELAEAA